VKTSLFLQPPIDTSERRRLLNATRQARSAKIGAEVRKYVFFPVCVLYLPLSSCQKTPSKRAREDDDLDLDGEERLRLGKSLKKRATEHTSRWKNPRKTGEQDGVHGGRVISPEQAERLRLRKQLADVEKQKAIRDTERVMQEADEANDLW
jgi:hypothetical protein